MSATENFREIPAALPNAPAQEEREKLIENARNKIKGEDDLLEIEDEEFEEELEGLELGRPSKKKLFLAFMSFVFLFLLLLSILSWFFEIGFFSRSKTETVDRTNNQMTQNEEVLTEDQKLKSALEMVAEKNAEVDGNTLPDTDIDLDNSDEKSVLATDTSLPVDSETTVIVPNEDPKQNTNQSPNYSQTERRKTTFSQSSASVEPIQRTKKKEKVIDQVQTVSANFSPNGRSLFFGVSQKDNSPKTNQTQPIKTVNKKSIEKRAEKKVIPFGTLLPIRFVGTVFSFQGASGLVRMEITKHVTGKSFKLEKGTTLVGEIRESKHDRIFISVKGLIDSQTNSFKRISGEVIEKDGTSGIRGKRRKRKRNWSRIWKGIREAGSVAVGAIGGFRGNSNGTVIISDSSAKASRVLSDEASQVISGKRNSNEFVEVLSGTKAFVLITTLSKE